MRLKISFLIFAFVVFLPFTGYSQTPAPIPTLLPIAPAVKKQIQALKQMKDEISAEIKTKKIKKQIKGTGDNEELVEKESLYTDTKGRVRAYFSSHGDGDMVISTNYFYDEAGKLRIVANHFGHYSIGTQDQTIFLDSNGGILRVYLTEELNNLGEEDSQNDEKPKQIKRELREPETMPYSGGKIELVWNPKKAFAEPLEKTDSK